MSSGSIGKVLTLSVICIVTGCSGADGGRDGRHDAGGEGDDAGTRQQDAGLDHDDAGTDGGTGDDTPPFALPVIRIGTRYADLATLGPFEIQGSISVPAGTPGVTSFADWTFSSMAEFEPVAATAVGEPQTIEGSLVSTLSLSLHAMSDDPITGRHIFSALSPDGAIVLTGTLTDSWELHFSVEETARQALALAPIRVAPMANFINEYLGGMRAGDSSSIDESVPAVSEVMKNLMLADGENGIQFGGFARPQTPVFQAVDAATGTFGAPEIEVPVTPVHLGVVRLAMPGGKATFMNHGVPMSDAILGDAEAFSFIVDDFGTKELYLRQRLEDGRQSLASRYFEIADAAESTEKRPNAPTAEIVDGRARACGGEPGLWLVFMTPDSTFSYSFAVERVPSSGGCVTVDFPEGIDPWLFQVMQVSADLRYSGLGLSEIAAP